MRKKSANVFHKVIDHINQSWLIRKKYAYPFGGRDIRELKNLSRIFKEWGVMALWDVFVASDNDWVRKSGFSIGAFVKCIPWLVDDGGWKVQASKYELELVGGCPREIVDLFKDFKMAASNDRKGA